MTLGETIYTLRNARGMSQGDLAERLHVSRQSVSKWENNTSVPELDKLLLLSDVFHISLDELTGRSPTGPSPASAPQAPPQAAPQRTFGTQRIIGFILLALGLLCCVLSFFFGSGGLAIGGYCIVCGILCLKTGKYAGLIIGWLTLLPAILLAPLFTSVRMFDIFHLSAYAHGISIQQIVAIAMWLCLFALLFFTIRAARTYYERRK
ncbi:MAG: helix-turn-helix domain-containing protein [Agathobaculum sp.]|jgi:transcriptional regulator with XRE-family HTH domain|uniref:helix-turn-helix domain-containing protein n=1 Tax=Agathobaculum sp. TaxID=2048138 RepID=UPI003D8F7BE6